MNDKTALRAKLRARRRALSPATQQRHAVTIASRVAQMAWFRSAQRVALYSAADGEVDTNPLAQRSWHLGKEVFLPRIRADRRMEFALYRRGDTLQRGIFGTLEPHTRRRALLPDQLDIVFTPLVGFTASGVRLGMGGGFYDRCFSQTPRPLLIGLAHYCQREDAIPAEAWDVVLTQVITEQGALKRAGDLFSAGLRRRRLR